MATTATTLTPDYIREPFIGLPPQLSTLQSPIPQAELSFVTFQGSVTAAASTEDQLLTINCVLPTGYAYIFQGASLLLEETEAGDLAAWDQDFGTFLRNTNVAGPRRWLAGLKFAGGELYDRTAALKARIFVCPGYNKLIRATNGDGLFSAAGRNVTIDEGAVTVYFVANFLEFDLNQARHWAVNTPIPVR